MRRRVLNILAVVSLVLCLATAALWIRSYHHWDQIEHWSAAKGPQPQMAYACASVSGMLINLRANCSSAGPRRGWLRRSKPNPGRASVMVSLGSGFWLVGFGCGHNNYGTTGFAYDQRWITLPDWSLVLLLALAPALGHPQAPPDLPPPAPSVQEMRLRSPRHTGGRRSALGPLPGMRERSPRVSAERLG